MDVRRQHVRGAGGAAEFATEPALAKRLRRLAELTFAELGARATTSASRCCPGRRGRPWRAPTARRTRSRATGSR